MFDLEIDYENRPTAAVEITAAADAESIELWKLINGGGRWIDPELAGGWSVVLLPQACARRLHKELPGLLRQLEQAGVREIRVNQWHPVPFSEMAADLGISHVFQGGTDFPGSIYPNIELPEERSGGWVAEAGDSLADWIGMWTAQPQQAHNLTKLRNSGAPERHLFVILPGFADAPFAATDLLMRDNAPLPTIAPVLPEEVTHLWVMSTWSSGDGMRWDPEFGWQHFDKQVGRVNR